MDSMMKSKIGIGNAFNHPAIKRMSQAMPKTGMTPEGEGTHYMQSMDNYAVPLLQDLGEEELTYIENPSPGPEDIRFNSPEEAEYFAKHYKDVAPMSTTFKDINKLQDGGNVEYDYVNYGTPEYQQAYEQGRFAHAPNPLEGVTLTPYDKDYPFYQNLSPQEKKMFNDKGPVGRGVRRKAQTERGLAEDTLDVVNPLLYGVAGGFLAPYAIAPIIEGLGAAGAAAYSAAAPTVTQALSSQLPLMSSIPGATLGNALIAADVYYSADQLVDPKSDTRQSISTAIEDPSLGNIASATGHSALTSTGFIFPNYRAAKSSLVDDFSKLGNYIATETPLKPVANKISHFAKDVDNHINFKRKSIELNQADQKANDSFWDKHFQIDDAQNELESITTRNVSDLADKLLYRENNNDYRKLLKLDDHLYLKRRKYENVNQGYEKINENELVKKEVLNESKSLSFRGGKEKIVDLKTGKEIEVDVNFGEANERVILDPVSKKVNKIKPTNDVPTVQSEYIETVKNNIDFIEKEVPGVKIFGSAKHVAEGRTPHIIGDYDGMISQSNFEKIYGKKNQNFDRAVEVDVPGEFGKNTKLELNVIQEVGGKATGNRALEIFKQVDPDAFSEAAKASLKNNSDIKIPYSAQELIDKVNPTVKSIVDAYEAFKNPKNINKIDGLINYSDPNIVIQGQEAYVKSLVGSRGTIGHQFPIEQLSNVEENKRLLQFIDFTGNIDNVAKDPKRVQAAINDYYINNTVLSREVRKDKFAEEALKKYNPDAGGGSVYGIGQNHVTLGSSFHQSDIDVIGVKQIGMTLDISSPMKYVNDLDHKVSGTKNFSEQEVSLLKELYSKYKINDNSDYVKNTIDLIEKLPYSKEGKNFLYDFAKRTNREIVKRENIYGNSNFVSTLRDFDETVDSMIFNALDNFNTRLTLKSSEMRKSNIRSSKNINVDEIFTKEEFQKMKGILENGIDKVAQRQEMVKNLIQTVKEEKRAVAIKYTQKKYKNLIEEINSKIKKLEAEKADLYELQQQFRKRRGDLNKSYYYIKELKETLGILSLGAAGATFAGDLVLIPSINSNYESKILKLASKYDSNRRGKRKKETSKEESPQYQKGGIIKDDRGQWAHPGEITEINSPNITMKGVPYPVLGISDTGDTQMMYPEEEYKFVGNKVTEYPLAKNGSALKRLDDLTNFTNYNKPQSSGWLSKYE